MDSSSPDESTRGVTSTGSYRLPADWEPQDAVWMAWPQYAYIGADLTPQPPALRHGIGGFASARSYWMSPWTSL
jgi:hypothetical protein